MDDQQFIKKLHSKGYKVTPQRLAICKLLFSSKDHPSADQIYQEVKKQYPTISLATVYFTLDLLKDLGLVQELGFSDRSSRYDYEAASAKKLWSQIVAEMSFTPLRQRLDIYTLCDKCSKT
jgi:Fur family peroxide stress response transcriptional regulator